MASFSFTQKKNLKLRYEQYYSAVKFLDAESVTNTVEIPTIINEYGNLSPVDSSDLVEKVNTLIVHKSNLVILNNLNDAMNETIKYINDRLNDFAIIPKYLNKIAASNVDNIGIFAQELKDYLVNFSGSFVGNFADPSLVYFDTLSASGEQYRFFGSPNQYPVYDISGNSNLIPQNPPPDIFRELLYFKDALVAVQDWADVSSIKSGLDTMAPIAFMDGNDYDNTISEIHDFAYDLSGKINASIDAYHSYGNLNTLQNYQSELIDLIIVINLEEDSENFYEAKQKLMRAIKRRVTLLDL